MEGWTAARAQGGPLNGLEGRPRSRVCRYSRVADSGVIEGGSGG